MQPHEVVAVLTAAGRSSRMGQLKALMEWQGLPLVAYQVQALAGLRETLVVLGHEAARIRPFVPLPHNVRVIENAAYETGRTSSLLAGFRAIGGHPAGILVVAVDQPIVPDVLTELLRLHDPRAPIAVPTFQGKRGHPVLFRGDLLPELLAIDDETEGLRAVVAKYRDQRQEVPVQSQGIWLDLNAPEDYSLAIGG